MAGVQPRRFGDLDRRRADDRHLPRTETRKLTAAASAPRLDRFLSDNAPDLSRSAAARLIKGHLVLVNGHPADPADRVAAGDVVEFEIPEAYAVEVGAEQIPLEIVYEDEDIAVIDKPAGMVVHPAPGHYTGTLVHALLGRGGEWSAVGGAARPGIVHRLDKGTSGLIVVARNDLSHRSLSSQLKDRTLSRTYLAISRGRLKDDAGELEGPIGRHPQERKRMAVVAGGRFARTRYEVVERKRTHTLLRCDLDTGRTHQIRVHLAALGHPVAGDGEYGGREPGLDRPMLHAWRLRLRHPRTGAEMSFETDPPVDFTSFWKGVE
ncbi:MAG TPA: RluA family pseudouridine synthase [Candidatus Limnocylindrales bacterium]|nr:RluA family pseudouridine synthase [Candidatus Limnocylindrales bacterium]